MDVDERTRAFLRSAQLNYEFAQAILNRQIQPAPLNWLVVVAFYSAVHYVNAYLWEMLQIEPKSHGERTDAIHTLQLLRSFEAEYDALRDWAYLARYEPTFRVTDQRAQRALRHLDTIRVVVRNDLS